MIRRPAAAKAGVRRPAAAPGVVGVGRRRRPAAGEAPEAEAGEGDVKERYSRGEVVQGHLVPPGSFCRGDWVVSAEGTYYQQPVSLAAKVEREEIEGGERELRVLLTGTRSEELLKYGSSQTPCRLRLHLCQPSCNQLRENPDLVHIKKLRKVKAEDPKEWEVNLTEEPETQLLRADQAEWERREAEKTEADRRAKKRSESSEGKRKKKRKKKKKKEERSERGEKDSPERRKVGGRGMAKKPLTSLYRGTGFDPDPKKRRRLARKVKRALRKNKDTSSSTGSSSSSSPSEEGEETLLQDRSRVHRIAMLAPGLLASESIQLMKPYLTQVTGSGWESDTDSLPPLLCQYARAYILPRMSGGVSREFLTLSWIGDLLIQGRVAEALDTTIQRLKSVELTTSGTPWMTSQKLELVPPGEVSMGSRQEVQVAQKEARLDQAVKGSSYSSEKGRPKGREKGKEKGKEKGRGKGKDSENKKSA